MTNDFQNFNSCGFARVRIFRGTCYGSPALTIEINFEADKVSAEFSEGFKNSKVLLERTGAETFLSKIFGIIEQPEILSNLRHVEVRYHAEIEWKNLNFIKDKSFGKLKLFSDEWHTEEIEYFIQQEAETVEIAERFQKILDKKPHRHALEIYSAVKDFAGKYLK